MWWWVDNAVSGSGVLWVWDTNGDGGDGGGYLWWWVGNGGSSEDILWSWYSCGGGGCFPWMGGEAEGVVACRRMTGVGTMVHHA